MSLPATKGFEIGSGFAGTLLTGSEHNDEFYTDELGEVRTVTNRSGGVQVVSPTVKILFCGWRLSQRLRFVRAAHSEPRGRRDATGS